MDGGSWRERKIEDVEGVERGRRKRCKGAVIRRRRTSVLLQADIVLHLPGWRCRVGALGCGVLDRGDHNTRK